MALRKTVEDIINNTINEKHERIQDLEKLNQTPKTINEIKELKNSIEMLEYDLLVKEFRQQMKHKNNIFKRI